GLTAVQRHALFRLTLDGAPRTAGPQPREVRRRAVSCQMRLAGKVALISGGARGMGAVEARLFVQEGAKVVIGDILEAAGRAVEADIRATGGDAVFVRLDVTREADWQRAVSTAGDRFGKLDILINNAGIGGSSRLDETTVEAWDRVMEVNAK